MDLVKAIAKIDKIFKDEGYEKATYQGNIGGALVVKYDFWEEVNPAVVEKIKKHFDFTCMRERDEDCERYIYIVTQKKEETKPHPMDRPNKIGKVKDLIDNDREENYG